MVNKLSDLAEFLHDDSLPLWLQGRLRFSSDEISPSLQ